MQMGHAIGDRVHMVHTVFIVDDHPIFAEGLSQLIAEDTALALCGVMHEAPGALVELKRIRPHVLVCDISLSNSNGLELIKSAKADNPDLRALVISMHDETLYGERALRAGASGYVMKHARSTVMLEAISAVAQGKLWVSELLAARMIRKAVHRFEGGGSDGSPMHVLSDRELEIFQLIGSARGTREISEALHISVKTVESHRLNIKQKLHLRTGLDLVRTAMQWALEIDRV